MLEKEDIHLFNIIYLSVEFVQFTTMIGDFMTKPNQGALFKKFKDQIMGVIPAQDPGPGPGPKKKTKKEEEED